MDSLRSMEEVLGYFREKYAQNEDGDIVERAPVTVIQPVGSYEPPDNPPTTPNDNAGTDNIVEAEFEEISPSPAIQFTPINAKSDSLPLHRIVAAQAAVTALIAALIAGTRLFAPDIYAVIETFIKNNLLS